MTILNRKIKKAITASLKLQTLIESAYDETKTNRTHTDTVTLAKWYDANRASREEATKLLKGTE